MRNNYTAILRKAIEAAEPLPYHFILLDCPPFLGAITQNALSAANLLIIPTQAEFFSAYAPAQYDGHHPLDSARKQSDLAYRILITMLDRRNRTHRNIQEQLQNTFGKGLFETVIEIDTKLRESPIAAACLLPTINPTAAVHSNIGSSPRSYWNMSKKKINKRLDQLFDSKDRRSGRPGRRSKTKRQDRRAGRASVDPIYGGNLRHPGRNRYKRFRLRPSLLPLKRPEPQPPPSPPPFAWTSALGPR
jgi:hypothetical protein